MPRRLLAGLLWSGAEARHALARLRDVLHDVRASLLAQGLDILGADASAIWLLAEGVTVEIAERSAGWPFLAELQGIDPQLDDWLARAEGGAPRGTLAEARAQPDRGVPSAARRASVLVSPLNNLAGARAGHLDVAATDAIVAALSALRSVSVLVEVPGRPVAGAGLPAGRQHPPCRGSGPRSRCGWSMSAAAAPCRGPP